MAYVALARKYRPRSFADLVGQEHVAAGLAGAVAKDRVAHAYLLTGPRGVGKTSAARILAMALNCERRAAAPAADGQGEPCGVCDSCTRIWSGAANLDVVEIDAASNRGVDDARDLRERAMYAASGPGRHKVYIVDEAHMLTREAWNALLKILEEPPPQVVFVFATTEPVKIANTAAPVLSRLQRFDFRRLGPAAVAERLRYVADRESLAADDAALQLIARVADGGMRDALSMLDQAAVFGDGTVTAAGVRGALGLIDDELYGELLGIVAERRTADVFPYVARVVEAGADLAEFVNGAGEVVRAVLLRVVGGDATASSEPVRRAVERYADRFREGDLLRILKLLAEAEMVIRRSPNARLHVETLLVQWTLLDRTVELADVLAALRRPGAPVSGEGVPGAPPVGGGSVAPRTTPPAVRAERAGPAASAPGPVTGELTLEAIVARWPQVLEAVGRTKRLLRESAAHATPAALASGVLTLTVDGAVHLDGLERGRAALGHAVAQVTGQQVRLALEPAPPAEARRLDPRADRQARLDVYRAKDPALDRAADVLDLELTE